MLGGWAEGVAMMLAAWKEREGEHSVAWVVIVRTESVLVTL